MRKKKVIDVESAPVDVPDVRIEKALSLAKDFETMKVPKGEKIKKKTLCKPAVVKKAHKAVLDTLEMKPIKRTKKVKGVIVEEEILPTHTNRLQAAQLVLDRVEPVVQRHENVNVNLDFSPIDLSQYRTR